MYSKLLYAVIALVLFSLSAKAQFQSPIMRQNADTTKLYLNVPDAITASKNGDTIYIPGGTWNLVGNTVVNKRLHIFGVGHHPDSSSATFITYLTGTLLLGQGASGGSLNGVLISSDIGVTSASDTIVNYSLRRCRINGTFSVNSYFSNNFISENVFIGQVYSNGSNPINNGFYNNIFGACVFNWNTGTIFRNNIFLNFGSCSYNYNCLYQNNVFLASGANFVNGFQYCVFQNNLFVDNISFPFTTGNTGSNNIVNQSQSSIFMSQSGTVYNYSHDYQLKPSCPGKNAGTDATDIGVYGSNIPWKDGSIPLTPHVQFRNIANSTDNSGNLLINIKVKAQDR